MPVEKLVDITIITKQFGVQVTSITRRQPLTLQCPYRVFRHVTFRAN